MRRRVICIPITTFHYHLLQQCARKDDREVTQQAGYMLRLAIEAIADRTEVRDGQTT